ncbi:ATPase ARSA1-like isoform X2 [Oryza brachyantha]|uniref:ATPase ARSA1-like isoform X2 n=1 Tax=Oryza brachyantha TaxID=4533 RepID=UPI001ADA6A96|nr:ATPase ARSA1-like isoform X2 [Oryza brachyantha]
MTAPTRPLPLIAPVRHRDAAPHPAVTAAAPSARCRRRASPSVAAPQPAVDLSLSRCPPSPLLASLFLAGSRGPLSRRDDELGGKGGVVKTSYAGSLALRFANNGHPTIVVSTDLAHSLSDSFAQVGGGGLRHHCLRLRFGLLKTKVECKPDLKDS